MDNAMKMEAGRNPAGFDPLWPEVHRGGAGLEAIRGEWAELARRDRCGHYFHHPQWLGTALEWLAGDADIWFFLFRDRDGNGRAVIPLQRRGGEWRFPRDDQTSYVDLVAVDEEAARGALQALPAVAALHGKGRIHLDRVLEGANALLAPDDARVEPVPGKRSDWLDLEGGSEAVLGRVGRHFRKELRRKGRRAEECGEVAFRIDRAGEASAEERTAALDDFLALESAGWKGRAGTAIARDPRLLAFYRAVLEAAEGEPAGTPRWRIHRLFIGGECVAAQLALEAGSTVYLLKIAFHEGYAAASPGLLAIARLLESLDGEPGIRWLTFVTGNRHQDVWRPRELGVHAVTLYTPDLAGRAARLLDRTRSELRGVRAAVRRYLGRRGRSSATGEQ